MPYIILIIHVGVSGTTVKQTQMTYLLFPQAVIVSLDNMFCFFFFFLKCQNIKWLHNRYIIVLWLEDDTGHREMTLIYQSVCQYEYIKAVSRQHNTSRLIGISLVQTFTVIWTTPCANNDIHIKIHSCTLACAWDLNMWRCKFFPLSGYWQP